MIQINAGIYILVMENTEQIMMTCARARARLEEEKMGT
jgi:hypothetical protein